MSGIEPPPRHLLTYSTFRVSRISYALPLRYIRHVCILLSFIDLSIPILQKKPADHLRSDPIIHQYPDILNPWSKVKIGGNRPRHWSLGCDQIIHHHAIQTVTGCIGRGEDAIPHRLALLSNVQPRCQPFRCITDRQVYRNRLFQSSPRHGPTNVCIVSPIQHTFSFCQAYNTE